MKIRQQGLVLMCRSASSTQQPPVLPHQPFLDLDLGAGVEGLQQGQARMLVTRRCCIPGCPCSLLLPYPGVSLLLPALPCQDAITGGFSARMDVWFAAGFSSQPAGNMHAQQWVTACYQQMGEDRWEEWWKVTGYGLNASTSIARLNPISLPAVTIE